MRFRPYKILGVVVPSFFFFLFSTPVFAAIEFINTIQYPNNIVCSEKNQNEYLPKYDSLWNFAWLNVQATTSTTGNHYYTGGQMTLSSTGGAGTSPVCTDFSLVNDGLNYYLVINSDLNTPSSGLHTVYHQTGGISRIGGIISGTTSYADNSKIISITTPTENQTFSTTSIPFNYILYNNPYFSTLSNCKTNFFNDLIFQDFVSATSSVSAGTNYIFSTTTLPIGKYTALVFCEVAGGGATSFDGSVRHFSVGSTTMEDIYGVNPNDFEAMLGLATTTCSIGNLSGCFQNALVFLFFPSASSTNKILSIKDLLIKKPPFGYISAIIDTIKGINASSTPKFSLLITDNIKNNILPSFTTGLAVILWFFYLVHFYKRLKHLQIF